MARLMARRSASRTLFAVLAVAAVVGVTIWAVRGSSASKVGDASASSVATPSVASTATERDAGAAGQIDQQPPSIKLLSNPPSNPPSTQPTTSPSGKLNEQSAAMPPRRAPEGDSATILRDAAAKRDAGDLVTARDLVNDTLAAGRFSGSEVQDAKAFVGALNEKIILGTQKFPADPFNKDWKVAPGTALVKLAKRFDVTANLLCRVNGLSDAGKLKSGITIKTIQGPFHVVVSKSRFEADVYLGAPGGAGSMFIKTLRVGLGADGSTPTGTWQVDIGKVVNPVYYSARGEGVIAADDPKNPLGERWIPLKGIEGECVGKESYGIHGTIDPSSIGKNMSQGCIRLASDDINLLYDLLVEGKSTVKVVD